MYISDHSKKLFYMICLSLAIILIFLPNSESNASTNTTEYNYDNSGRLIYTDTNNGMAIINRYDNAGNLIVKKVVKIPSVEAPAEVSLSNASYDVYAYGIKKDATSVSFPTWTEANGNDDLENPWVQGQKVSEGVWKATVPFSKHNNETGLYDNDVWVDGKFFGGAKTMVKETTSLRAPEKVEFKAGFYEVVLEGVSDQVQRVTFPTWTEANGQDDIKHVEGQKQANGTWKATIPFSEHNYETGIYTTHAYCYDQYGNSIGIWGASIQVVPGVEAPAEVSLSNASYDVYAYGVAKGATSVSFPTWTEANGNDDLENPWVQGQKVSEGVWKATVPFSKHNNETGLYDNDVWVDG
ncbi:GBS Bsp-like repeat-containing protein, partial [Paenibacillus tyrfis]|uniref:GBS Bsp-like repeat-containing protein n=1 Tax=Paenibacillus tyrfis TaxID=1501230 RepID=UPI00248F96EA